jgi:hypothetical protein
MKRMYNRIWLMAVVGMLCYTAGAQTNYTNYSGFAVDTTAILPPSEVHPSLFFVASEIPQILARKDAGGYALTTWNYILADIATFKSRTPSSTTVNTRPQMAKILGFGWIMLGDTTARNKAIQALLIAYDNVPRTEVPSSFDGDYDEIYRATWLQNYCAAYDWVEGAMTVQQDSIVRAKLTQETQLLRANMVTGVRYAPRPHNHRSKPAWAIATAALTFSSDARASDWLSFALAQANTVTRYMYSADGIYREGGHYSIYNFVNLIPFLWQYKNVSGVDLFPAHRAAFEWPVLVRTGNGWLPHFEDSYVKPAPTHMVAKAYTATSTRLHSSEPLSKILQWNFFHTNVFDHDYTGATNDVVWEIDEYLTYDQSIAQVSPSINPTVNLASGQTIFRSGWDYASTNHRYLVFHGVAESDNHDQPNQLSFLLEGENAILATPPGYGKDGFSDTLRDSWYIKPFANNLVTLSDNEPVDSAQNATPRNNHFLASGFFDFAEKSTIYPTASGRIRRSIAFPAHRYWVVTDFVSANTASPFKMYLHGRGSMTRNDSLVTWTTSNDTFGPAAKLHAFIFTEGTPTWSELSGWTSMWKDQVAQQYVSLLRNTDSTSFMEVLIPKSTSAATPVVYDRSVGATVASEVVEGTTSDLFIANRRRSAVSVQQTGTNALFAWRRSVSSQLVQFGMNEGSVIVSGTDTIVATTSPVTLAMDRSSTTLYTGVIDSLAGAVQVSLQTLVRSDSVQSVLLNDVSIPFIILSPYRIRFSVNQSGTLRIQLGALPPVSGVVTSAASGNWSSTATWQGGVLPAATDTVVIRSVDTVTVDISFSCAELRISGVFQTSKSSLVDMTINGNLIVNTGATFRAQAAQTSFSGPHTLTITGNITHNGSVFDCRTGSAGSTLGVINTTFAGATNSVVTINGSYSSSNGDFNAVTINKLGNARVILGSDLFVNGGSSTGPASMNSLVTFINGIVETGSYTFVAQTSTAANVAGASAASYVLGAMGRGLSNSVGSTKDFPVGDSAGFRPLNLRSTTAGTATGHYATVRVLSGDANTGSSVLNGNIDRVSAVRYYRITYASGSGGAATMSFDRFYPTYGIDDGVPAGNIDLRVAYSTDNRGTWTRIDQNRNPHTTSLTNPPTQIKPDSLYPPVALTSGGNSIYIALADTMGGANPLQRSTLIVASSGANGNVSPAGMVTVLLGTDRRFVFTPDSGYQTDSVLVDGNLVDSTAGYTFSNIHVAHTLSVTFRTGNPTTTVGVALAAGWNLISNPVTNPIPGDSVLQLYPTSVNSYAFEFNAGTGYAQRYRLANGIGYWEKFAAALSQSVTGTVRTVDSVSVSAGWNIVGSISCTVDTSTIVSIPPGIRASNWFAYAGGYSPVNQILPGHAYWVKATGTGKFALSCAAHAEKQISLAGPEAQLNALTISDAAGNSQTLYFGIEEKRSLNAAMYDLPPLPPAGAFDARFETAGGGTMVRTVSENAGDTELPLAIQCDSYPLTIAWSVRQSGTQYLLAGSGNQAWAMSGDGSVRLAGGSSLAIRTVNGAGKPGSFALKQNYPNPFNPSTQIQYDLPVDCRVSLEIFNVIGQRIRVLAQGDEHAGFRSREWDGKGDNGEQRASGVYFVSLVARGNDGIVFTAVQRMLLLR